MKLYNEKLTEQIISSAIEVHRCLGPGLLENIYETSFCKELGLRNIAFQRQKPIPLNYKGIELDCEYRIDVIVKNTVIVEIKAVETLLPIHEAQLLTYLKLSGLHIGLLINFNVPILKDSIKRFVL